MSNTTSDSNSYIANAMYVAPYTKITIKTAHFYTHNTGGSQGGRFYFTSNSSGSLGTNPSAVDSNNRKDWTYSSESAGTLKGGTFGNTQIFTIDNLAGSSNLKFWAVIGGSLKVLEVHMLEGKVVVIPLNIIIGIIWK